MASVSPVARLLAGLLLTAAATASCTSVLPHVSLPELVLGEPSFFPTLEAYAGAPIVGGNQVDVLLNGQEIFPAKIEAIRGATRSITFAQYYYDEGLVSRDVADALAERCRAGVKTHVLFDAFGTLGMPPEYSQVLEAAGCRLAFFRPLTPWGAYRANNRNHRRILVVDGKLGFTGGSGVSRKWMGDGRTEGHWRDTDVRVGGPVVQYLQGAFAENWLEATGQVLGGPDYFPSPIEPRGKVPAQVVRSSPASGGAAMYTTFLLAMASARRSIYITNPYFVPDAKMRDTLVDAVHRGVRVVLLLPGVIDYNIIRHASRRHFGRLLKEGVSIHEYRDGLLHAKTMVIDGVWATIGTTNLDNRSFALNEEINLVIYDRSVARRLEAVFADDLAHATVVDYRRWSARGLLERLLEFMSLPLQANL